MSVSFQESLARRVFSCLFMMVILLPLVNAPAGAQPNRSLFWHAYDTEITINTDGSFHVKETQIVAFNGSYSHGTRTISIHRVEQIENVSVAIANSQAEIPTNLIRTATNTNEVGTYSLNQTTGFLEIVYHFDRTTGSEDRVIVIEYDVFGGLRAYPDESPSNQQLWWVAVSSDVTSSTDVRTSNVIVHLPERVGLVETIWRPESGTSNGRTWIWQWSDLRPSVDYDIRLQFPPITEAVAPSWQLREESNATPMGD